MRQTRGAAPGTATIGGALFWHRCSHVDDHVLRALHAIALVLYRACSALSVNARLLLAVYEAWPTSVDSTVTANIQHCI